MTVRDDNTVDASRVVSPQCFARWKQTRTRSPPYPEAVFQRTLSGHLTAADGRGECLYLRRKEYLTRNNAAPFTSEEETAILVIVREKKTWACFEASAGRGRLGYRELASGY
jgi:hypothetical protein